MPLITKIMTLVFAPRMRQIEYFKSHPIEVQAKQFARLVRSGEKSSFGQKYDIRKGMSYEEFRGRVPVMEYPDLAPYSERIRKGEKRVTWPTKVGWLCKSSGTTGSASKYIPLTKQGLRDSHMRGPKDVAAIYTHLYPSSRAFTGKAFTLGGSKRLEMSGDRVPSGDLSSVLIDNTPRLAMKFRVPRKEIALMASFDEKVERICAEAESYNVTSFAGVPSWNLVMLERILKHTGKRNMLEVWPNMELFIHGGMSFKPYRAQYERMFPSESMRYLETYNASEGFFGIAEECNTDEMLLMLDYNCFYEFWPTESLTDTETIVPLEGVECGKNYAMIITSSNGLWRYMIGDTIKFTSTTPYKFRFTGRTKLFVNAFGEEVIIDDAEKAIESACAATGAEIEEYTMAPIFMEEVEGDIKGAHEWVVSFRKAPEDMEQFTLALDNALREENCDYNTKRTNNFTLTLPRVVVVPSGTFEGLLREEGRLGGQIKIPRLSGERNYVERLKAFATKQKDN